MAVNNFNVNSRNICKFKTLLKIGASYHSCYNNLTMIALNSCKRSTKNEQTILKICELKERKERRSQNTDLGHLVLVYTGQVFSGTRVQVVFIFVLAAHAVQVLVVDIHFVLLITVLLRCHLLFLLLAICHRLHALTYINLQ